MTSGRKLVCVFAALFFFALISVPIVQHMDMMKRGFHDAGDLEAADFRRLVSIRIRSSSHRSFLDLGELELGDFGPEPTAPAPAPATEPENAPISLPPLPFLPLCLDEHSPPLAKFVQPLSFPPVIDLSLLNGTCLTLSAFRTTQRFHPDLPPTTVYAFGTSLDTATTPGPTLLARRYVEACVRWENHITDDWHFLPLAHNSTVEWANPRRGGVPIVVHLQGGEVAPIHDGNPDAWFTSRNETGPAFVTQNYVYPNHQNAMALWYHDHTLGITRLNNLAGLSGLYIIRPTEEEELALDLPEGIPLVLRDIRFFPNGSINVPGPRDFDPQYWCPEWYDTWSVNGRLWPYVNVRRAAYRFRVLLASNARYVGLYLNAPGHINVTMHLIGTDGGFLDEPISTQNMLLFPSDRIDIIIDFSGFDPGREFFLMNFPMPVDGAVEPFLEPSSAIIMKFTVVSEGGLQDGIVRRHDYLRRLREAASHHKELNVISEPSMTREIPINLLTNETTHRGYAFIFENLIWRDPVRVEPIEGSTEVWEFINLSENPHSMHIHLIQFQVINQQRIDMDAYRNGTCSTSVPYPNNGTCFLDYPESPSIYQQGWKDNVVVWNAYVLRLLIRYTTREGNPFSFDPTGEPGYALHCHILQHEDDVLMRPFKLLHKSNSI